MEKKSEKTVLEKVLAECEIAFQAKTPILYLMTDEIELINDVITKQQIVPYYFQDKNAGCIWSLRKFMQTHPLAYPDLEERFRRDESKGNHQDDAESRVIPLRLSDLADHTQTNFKLMKSGDTKFETSTFAHVYYLENHSINHVNNSTKLLNFVNEYISSEPGSFIQNSLLLIASEKVHIPAGLEQYVKLIEIPKPTGGEIRAIVAELACERGEVLTQAYLNKLVEMLKGFNKSQVKVTLNKILAQSPLLSNSEKIKGMELDELPEAVALKVIKEEKVDMLKKAGEVLTYVKTEDVGLGGLRDLCNWVSEKKVILDNLTIARENWNINFPKGVLISGIPGSGKSLLAQKISSILDIPLIKMNMGSLMGKYMGESENNLRIALKLAEAMAPCILFIDELEKDFAGVNNSEDGDSGTTKRIFGTFLSWMQDNKIPIFIFATSNDISRLPPEFLRRGRFDRKYYVFMPMRKECVEIFKARLEFVNSPKNGFKDGIPLFEKETGGRNSGVLSTEFIGSIVDYCCTDGRKKFLTGADIDGIVSDALASIFHHKGFLHTNPDGRKSKISADEMRAALIDAINRTRTYGETNLSDIAQSFISICEKNFLPASGNEEDRTLFALTDYQPDREVAIVRERSFDNSYDNVMYQTLREKINQINLEKKNKNKVLVSNSTKDER